MKRQTDRQTYTNTDTDRKIDRQTHTHTHTPHTDRDTCTLNTHTYMYTCLRGRRARNRRGSTSDSLLRSAILAIDPRRRRGMAVHRSPDVPIRRTERRALVT